MIKRTVSSLALVFCATTLVACGAAVESDELEGADFEAGGVAESAEAGSEPVGVTQQPLFQKCKNVRIEVRNERVESNGATPAIKVVQLSFDTTDDPWDKQGVSNEVIGYDTDHLYTEDLENADGKTITRWKVHYRVDLGNGWSSKQEQEINTVDTRCSDGMLVELSVTD